MEKGSFIKKIEMCASFRETVETLTYDISAPLFTIY